MRRAEPREGANHPPAELELGRERYRQRAWVEAHDALSRADRNAPLDAADLEQLAWSAGLAGRDEDLLSALARLYEAHLTAGLGVRAAYFAFWAGFRIAAMGDAARAGGWLARAQRLVESEDCVVHGYLLLPVVRRNFGAGEFDAALDAAVRAAAIGERFAETDLMVFARNLQGRVLLQQGKVEAGFALLDEALLAAARDEVSPTITGLIFCTSIDSCRRVYALDRARSWTRALGEWCDAQPQLATFTGACMVHRAEILQVGGAWQKAFEQAARACEPPPGGGKPEAGADAFYQQGEIHRLRGEFDAAEEAYRQASHLGREPQPGLSLLRLAQGRADAAASTIRRVEAATTDRLRRAPLLPAFVEIMLAVRDLDEARRAAADLDAIAVAFDSEVLRAMAAYSEGLVRLAAGEPQAAEGMLRRACSVWQEVDAPHEVARIRTALARAYQALGDTDGARLEFEAAAEAFERLGAAPDLAALRSIAAAASPGPKPAHEALTLREVQVLKLVATGKTNRVIAKDLCLSEKTVERHLSNIFAKTGVASRAAATAYAYENRLV